MSKKVVVIHYNHRFCGYHNDVDYEGNAVFDDELFEAAYVSTKKAKKVLADYARKLGMTVLGDGTVAVAKPANQNYPSEHEYLSIETPGLFLFDFGTMVGDILQADSYLGKISKKDRARYDAYLKEKIESYGLFRDY